MSSNVCFCLDLKSKPRQNTPAECLLFSFCLHATDLPLGQRQHGQHGAFWRPQMHPGIFKDPPAPLRRTPLVRFCTCELHESSPCSLDGPCLLCPLCFWSPSPTSSPRSFHNDIIHVRGGREGGGGELGGEGARLWHAKSQIQTDLIWEWQKHVAGYDKGRLCADTSQDQRGALWPGRNPSSQNLCYITEDTSEWCTKNPPQNCQFGQKSTSAALSTLNTSQLDHHTRKGSAKSPRTWLRASKHPFNLTELRTSFRTYSIPWQPLYALWQKCIQPRAFNAP